ncbi:MAG: hypothetical protein VYB57_04790 [Cyanobacteriota bacterium]|nr:hypothetical protein [Cyanobacteriota bacterium]
MLPELRWWLQLDRAVLQQPAPLPKLGAADAFDAQRVHQIGAGGLGKAMLLPALLLAAAIDQGAAQLRKARLQPLVQQPVGAALPAGWLGQGDGITKIAAMEHGGTAAGAAHHRDAQARSGGVSALVMPQRQGGLLPLVEAQQHRLLVVELAQHPAVQAHLHAA